MGMEMSSHLRDVLLKEHGRNSPSGGMAHPRALSGIKGSRVREGTWASQRAGRAGTKEAETA